MAGKISRRNITTGGGADEFALTMLPLLYLDGVLSFDSFRAINNCPDFDGRNARHYRPNGAGKTTMMDIITGKTRADEGGVFRPCRSISAPTMGDILPRHRRKFQKPTVFESHTVDNILHHEASAGVCFAVSRSGPESKRSPPF
jgi:ABC-type uncharacterized transport system ATPase subunit